MRKIFFVLLAALNIQLLYAEARTVKVLLPNNTWLETDLIDSDTEGNLTVMIENKETILRRKDFRLVKMPLPAGIIKAEELSKHNKLREAEEVLESIAVKYKFPPIESKIKVMLAELKAEDHDYRSAASLLTPLLDTEIIMRDLEAITFAQGFLILGNACSQLGNEEKAVKAYKRSFELAVPEYSALANLALGKMFLKQEHSKDALECFLENVFIFPRDTPGRKESLLEIIVFYKKHGDDRQKAFEAVLKKEYPEKK